MDYLINGRAGQRHGTGRAEATLGILELGSGILFKISLMTTVNKPKGKMKSWST